MGFPETILLGAIAGSTIFLGLPAGRMQHVNDRLRVGLAMLSVGILAFIFVDVNQSALDILNSALTSYKNHTGSLSHVIGLFVLLAGGFTIGTAGISAIERSIVRRRPPAPVPPVAGGSAEATLTVDQAAMLERETRRRALQTGMKVAVAIGLHNFAEGLAIGVSAKAGSIGLATVLIIGFSLHNASEGFGIVGPLGNVRPSWAWLGLAGIVGGGPTFVGTIVGYQVQSDPLELCFYALAGGAILYVVGEIWTAMRRYGFRTFGLYMLAFGFLLGVATDLIVTYGGA